MVGIFDSIKHAILEEDPEDLAKKQKQNPIPDPGKTRSVAAVSAAPVIVKTSTVINAEDRANAINLLVGRVFVGDTPYTEYRTTFDALADAIVDKRARRKASLSVVMKKHGADKVLGAIASHKDRLAAERTAFERSVSPEHGGVMEKLNADVAAKQQEITSAKSEIERLEAAVTQAEQAKDVLNTQVADELAKQNRARDLFESAHVALSDEIAEDEKLMAQ